MWFSKRKHRLDARALALTPNSGVCLDGRWFAYQPASSGEIDYVLVLEQHGMALFGHMQSTIATTQPIDIRGIVLENRVVAQYWRCQKGHMGSGMFDLHISDEHSRMEGTSTWYPEDAQLKDYSSTILIERAP